MIQDFLKKYKIKQICESSAIDSLNLNLEYKNNLDNTIFYGVYNNKDIQNIKYHKGKKWILWAGNDANIKYDIRLKIINFMKNQNVERHLVQNVNVEKNLLAADIVPLNINHEFEEKSNLEIFLEENNITQVYVSKAINSPNFKNIIQYKNLNENTLFYGMYQIDDINKFKNHKGKKWILWAGNDANIEHENRKNIIIGLNKLSLEGNLVIKDSIENNFKKLDIPVLNLNKPQYLNDVSLEGIQLKSSIDLKNFNIKKYNFKDYKSKNLPTLFVGLYNLKDVIELNAHKGIKYLLWGGKDTNFDVAKFKFNLFGIENSKDINHIAFSNEIYLNLKNKNINSKIIKLDDIDLFDKNDLLEAQEEEARKKAEEEARKKAEEEARKKAEEEARKKAQDNITIIINSYKPVKEDLIRSVNGCLKQINVNVKVIVSTLENDPTIEYINELNNSNVELVISLLNEHPGKGPKGIYFQLNKALKEVKTKYLSYFSSNDIIYPTKSYDEIKKIKDENTIFCFSKFRSYFPSEKIYRDWTYDQNKMTYDNLLLGNYVNDCATIDLSKLDNPLQFNYEKYGNTCHWNLWLTILKEKSEKYMSYNDNFEWDYIRDENKSQAIDRSKDKIKQELYYNQREFMLSDLNPHIYPGSMYKYDDKNEKFWWWNDTKNTKLIEMTVALPALNADTIIWLALESLKNQININFAWELIVFEEEGTSKSVVQSYAGQLPGCVRIIYKIISKDDAFYKLEDIKKNKCTSYYTLLEKWINMARVADKNSKIFVKHAVDCYSTPKRLYIHYEHFKNEMCYYSTQPKGYFYNINLDKWLLNLGYKFEPINSFSYGPWKINYLDDNYIDDPTISVRGCYLNIALRTNVMKLIPFSTEPKRSGLDEYILSNMSSIIGYRPEETKIVFTNDEVYDNWKYSIDIDGHNNISSGDNFYKKDIKFITSINKDENLINADLLKGDYILSFLVENNFNINDIIIDINNNIYFEYQIVNNVLYLYFEVVKNDKYMINILLKNNLKITDLKLNKIYID